MLQKKVYIFEYFLDNKNKIAIFYFTK